MLLSNSFEQTAAVACFGTCAVPPRYMVALYGVGKMVAYSLSCMMIPDVPVVSFHQCSQKGGGFSLEEVPHAVDSMAVGFSLND